MRRYERAIGGFDRCGIDISAASTAVEIRHEHGACRHGVAAPGKMADIIRVANFHIE